MTGRYCVATIDRVSTLHVGKAYDIPRCCRFLRRRSIRIRIAKEGIESSDRLGRHRWVGERALVWLSQFRRLTIRYARRHEIHDAFLSPGCALIRLKAIEWFC